MGRFYHCLILATTSLLLNGIAAGQEIPPDRLTVSFSDPSKPGLVRVGLLHGSISVQAYEGKEVILEARVRSASRRATPATPTEGMKRLAVSGTGLSVSEKGNAMDVDASSHNHTIDLSIQVPVRTSLKLNTVNSGNIEVKGVRGEVEAENVNGNVTLADVAGSAVAHALNGDVIARFTEVTPDKSMSFSSLNGKIDVTFPPSLRAKVSLKSENGDIYSDFDIRMEQTARQPIVEDRREKGGRYRVRIDKGLHGIINGDGPEIQFKNFNGSIYIRKGK